MQCSMEKSMTEMKERESALKLMQGLGVLTIFPHDSMRAGGDVMQGTACRRQDQAVLSTCTTTGVGCCQAPSTYRPVHIIFLHSCRSQY